MTDVVDRYVELLKRDKEYGEKYLTNQFFYDEKRGFVPALAVLSSMPWKWTRERKDVELFLNHDKSEALMKIEDFYSDELLDLTEEYFNFDASELSDEEWEKLYSRTELKNKLQNVNVPERLKECIRVYIECEDVCNDLRAYVKKKRNSEE